MIDTAQQMADAIRARRAADGTLGRVADPQPEQHPTATEEPTK